MSRTSRFLIFAALSATHLACEDQSTETASTGAITTVDSADVDIVRISDVQALDLAEVELRLIHSTTALPDLHLDRVAGAVFLPDSALVIADRGSRELVFLNRDGSLRARSGREGEGPGEYDWIERIGVGVGGVPFAFDRRQRRFTFLNVQGEVTRIQRLDQGAGLGAAVPLSRLESGEVLAALETRPTLPAGLQRGPVFLVLSSEEGEIVDTLGEWAGKERHVSAGDWNPVGFALTALFAGRGRHALVGTNDSLDLTLYRGTDPVTRIRGGFSARRVAAQEKDEWTERFLAMFPEDYQPGWRQRLERSTIRDTYPAYGAISVDSDGRIWIGDYPRLADHMRRWTILEPDGTPVAVVNLPVLFPAWLEDTVAVTSQPHEVLDVAHGRIAVLRRDEFDVEFVEVYEMGSSPLQ